MIKVLYVEDDAQVGQAVSALLRNDARFAWLGWSTDARAVVQKLPELSPDVLILDLDMPGADTEATLREISELDVPTRVLVFSGQNSHDAVEHSIEHGVWGFVSKADGYPALTQGILDVARGEFVLSPTARQILDRT